MRALPRENATGKGGALRLTSNDRGKIVESPAGSKPPILARLEAQGSTGYRHRPALKDILCRCPLCGEKLLLSDSEKYLFCFGPPSCAANRAPFESIIVRIR